MANGWIDGPLPGPRGPVPVLHFPREDQKPWSPVTRRPPLLCLHTTEGGTSLGDRYKSWEFPPNFAVGDGHIVQLFPLGIASEAVDTHDGDLLQVEIAYTVGAQSPTKVYLPPPSSLDPLVALVAYLHKHGHIVTGLKRPAGWPTALDRLPAAVPSYYRRHTAFPKAGVYGHVDIPDDEHYDPASFDYPAFFRLVGDVLAGDHGAEDDEMYAKFKQGWKDYTDALKKASGVDPGPPPDWQDEDRRFGWSAARFAANNPRTK